MIMLIYLVVVAMGIFLSLLFKLCYRRRFHILHGAYLFYQVKRFCADVY